MTPQKGTLLASSARGYDSFRKKGDPFPKQRWGEAKGAGVGWPGCPLSEHLLNTHSLCAGHCYALRVGHLTHFSQHALRSVLLLSPRIDSRENRGVGGLASGPEEHVSLVLLSDLGTGASDLGSAFLKALPGTATQNTFINKARLSFLSTMKK